MKNKNTPVPLVMPNIKRPGKLLITHLRNGFTLIELLLVIAIIGILSMIGLTSFRYAVTKAEETKLITDTNDINKIVTLYMFDHGAPTSCNPICSSSGRAGPSFETLNRSGLFKDYGILPKSHLPEVNVSGVGWTDYRIINDSTTTLCCRNTDVACKALHKGWVYIRAVLEKPNPKLTESDPRCSSNYGLQIDYNHPLIYLIPIQPAGNF